MFVATLQEPDTLITRTTKATVEHFPADGSCLNTGFDFMIRYSSYRGTNDREKPGALGSLEKEYRELQELRERVRKTEAAAAKGRRPRDKGRRPQE